MTDQTSEIARAAEERAAETDRHAVPRTPVGEEQRGMTVRDAC
jgi:hypothetical protein